MVIDFKFLLNYVQLHSTIYQKDLKMCFKLRFSLHLIGCKAVDSRGDYMIMYKFMLS